MRSPLPVELHPHALNEAGFARCDAQFFNAPHASIGKRTRGATGQTDGVVPAERASQLGPAIVMKAALGEKRDLAHPALKPGRHLAQHRFKPLNRDAASLRSDVPGHGDGATAVDNREPPERPGTHCPHRCREG